MNTSYTLIVCAIVLGLCSAGTSDMNIALASDGAGSASATAELVLGLAAAVMAIVAIALLTTQRK